MIISKTMNKNDRNKYYSHVRPEMSEFVLKDAKKILDIGCGEGQFSMQFRDRAETWGVEMNPDIAKEAQKHLFKVFAGDISSNLNNLPNNYFDCIVFNDVLEHMTDPYSLLKEIKSKLSPTGVIVCSIPNIRHISIIKKYLIKGQWKYEDFGIMDRTHFRFFTYKSIIEMFTDSGYDMLKIKGINASSWWKSLPINILTLGFFWDTRYIQFACMAKPK